ncbi:MAG: EFR1 family ferrodoxin [Clostridiaceae bacterium]
MIYYFSGTGNSKWAAERLAALTGERVESIAALLKQNPAAVNPQAGEQVGLVFPIYAWGAPLIVERFCKLLHVPQGSYAFAVCTCGDEAGNAMKRLWKNFPFQSAFSISMPNNYIPMFDVDSEETAKRKAKVASTLVEQIASRILAKERIYSVHAGSFGGLKTGIARPAFNAFARSTKPFAAGDTCNGCNLCRNVCPIGAIEMANGKPVWVKKHCTQCLACINRCPQCCIQYGAGTKGRGRYYFSDKLLKND